MGHYRSEMMCSTCDSAPCRCPPKTPVDYSKFYVIHLGQVVKASTLGKLEQGYFIKYNSIEEAEKALDNQLLKRHHYAIAHLQDIEKQMEQRKLTFTRYTGVELKK